MVRGDSARHSRARKMRKTRDRMQETFHNTRAGRLDSVLAELLCTSRNQAAQLLKAGAVTVNGIARNASWKLCGGEELRVCKQQAKPQQAQEMTLDVPILYEDDCLLVLNKPPMLVVHGAPSVREPTLCDWLAQKGYCLSTLAGENRHGIVHRLDKQTSGAIVIAKDNATHSALSAQLQSRALGRYYLAIVDRELREDTIFACDMARSSHNRLKMGKVPQGKGRFSQSLFVNLAPSLRGDSALIAAKLKTGRTHQIRCHLENLGRHILGDRLYGYRGGYQDRIMLHAYMLYLTHPKTQESLILKAPLFLDMLRYLSQNYDRERIDEVLGHGSIIAAFGILDERLHASGTE